LFTELLCVTTLQPGYLEFITRQPAHGALRQQRLPPQFPASVIRQGFRVEKFWILRRRTRTANL
jgi:hypothetical protein